MTDKQLSRRSFIEGAAALGTGVTLSLGSAASYARVIGANDRIRLGVVGLRSRGKALIESAIAAGGDGIAVHAVCDVDSTVLQTEATAAAALTGQAPAAEKDFRRLLEDRDIDAVVIATADHTHAPFSIYAMQADKHVFVEKPCSHNPREGELLVEAAGRYGKVVQMGNQQRSAPTSIEAVEEIRSGAIGRPYMGKAWYSNTRGSIGRGRQVAVPDWLDWELWQGPAPRRPYQDNVVHYDWHWFWHWGTGEINNNGLHEMDICRWALDVGHPSRVSSSGGRFQFDDDWEFYDTQVASYEFDNDTMITWEGRSCNEFKFFERGRGATIHGTEGTVLIDRNGYALYDNGGNLLRRVNERARSGTTDLVGGGALVDYHMANFFGAIRDGEPLRSPIDEGHISTLMCHLGNISQHLGRSLDIDPASGRISGDREAMRMWSREYERGWAPEL